VNFIFCWNMMATRLGSDGHVLCAKEMEDLETRTQALPLGELDQCLRSRVDRGRGGYESCWLGSSMWMEMGVIPKPRAEAKHRHKVFKTQMTRPRSLDAENRGKTGR